MKLFAHILGATALGAFCVVLFFQLSDYSIDSDQALSLFFAGGEGKLLYQEVINGPGPVEIPMRELKEYVNPSWFDNPLVTYQILAFNGETHPPLYYESLRFWLGWSSRIPIEMARFLSLLFALLASVFAGLWSRDLTGKALYFWPGALFSISSYHVIEQSGLIRMHTMTLFLVAVFTWSSSRLLKVERRRDLVVHHFSLLLGLCSTFFFPLYAAPIVLYRIYKSPRVFQAIWPYLVSQSPFIFWMSFYGLSQLFNLPYEDFSGLYSNAHGPALAGWDYRAYSKLFIYLTPFNPPYGAHKPAFWFVYSVVLGLALWLFKKRKKELLCFFMMPLFFVVTGEIFFDSIASQWASGRALNFFLLPMLMIFILFLDGIGKRWWSWIAPLLGMLIICVGFKRNYQAHQKFISQTPELIEEKLLREVNERKFKEERLAILMNKWVPQVLRTALYFRSYSKADAFIFKDLGELSTLKTGQYRNIVVISNPKLFQGTREDLTKYFTQKGYQVERELQTSSDHLEAQDFALLLRYVN